MITDRDVAALCNGIYAYPGDAPIAWDHYDDGADDGVVWALKKVEGVWILVFRGSVTIPDWLRDVEAIAVWNADLRAHVHPGFNANVKKALQEAFAIIGQDPWIATGHSLGAARADNATAYGIVLGHAPLACIVFGEPKPGFADFAALVNRVPRRSYQNRDDKGHDIVPDVPVTFLVEPYVHPSEPIAVSAPPPDYDGFDEAEYHHMPLYLQATPATPTIH